MNITKYIELINEKYELIKKDIENLKKDIDIHSYLFDNTEFKEDSMVSFHNIYIEKNTKDIKQKIVNILVKILNNLNLYNTDTKNTLECNDIILNLLGFVKKQHGDKTRVKVPTIKGVKK
jgi:phosphatidylserine/phosphatidylglycerophosphate/cardiolipin synthase-like enzyme